MNNLQLTMALLRHLAGSFSTGGHSCGRSIYSIFLDCFFYLAGQEVEELDYEELQRIVKSRAGSRQLVLEFDIPLYQLPNNDLAGIALFNLHRELVKGCEKISQEEMENGIASDYSPQRYIRVVERAIRLYPFVREVTVDWGELWSLSNDRWTVKMPV